MKGIKLIVTEINKKITESMKCSAAFAGSSLFDLADSASREGIPGSFPVVFDNAGGAIYVGVDEVNPLILYHRITGITFAANRASYGDKDSQNMVTSMRMAVFHDRRRIALDASEMAIFIYKAMPTHLKLPNFGNVVIRITSVVPNNQSAFQNEYPGGTPFFLKPEHTLINIIYQIESKMNADCFNICP